MSKLDMGLKVVGTNVYIYDIGTSNSSVPADAQWTIEWQSTGYVFKKNGDSSGTLQIRNASTIAGDPAAANNYVDNANCRWTLSKIASPPSGVYLYDTAKKAIVKNNRTETINVGETKSLSDLNLVAVAYSGNSIDQTFTWSTSDSDIATVDGNGKITSVSAGYSNINVSVIIRNTCYSASYKLNVTGLLIYQTRDKELFGFANPADDDDVVPIIKEDFTYGQKSTQDLLDSGTGISKNDLYNQEEQISITERKEMILNFFNSYISYDETFMDILAEMVNHVLAGTGDDFSDERLTNAVIEHPKTRKYTNAVADLVNDLIVDSRGDISKLYYDEDLWIHPTERAQQTVVAAMKEKLNLGDVSLYLPLYSHNNGVPGLTLAIDGWLGDRIEIVRYETDEETYSAVLRITFYDHFGLDTSDLSDKKYGSLTAGMVAGFRQWFIIQHWDELEATVQPKPFVTVVSIDIPIGGNL